MLICNWLEGNCPSADPAEAVRLHAEVTAIAKELTPIEERWCELQELVEADEA